MASEKLIETKLRLSESERASVEKLRGDRGQNVCLRRAVQQWIAREEMLQEAMRLGHPIPGINPNGAIIPAQPAPPPTDTGSVTRLTRRAKDPEVAPPVPVEEPVTEDADIDEAAEDQPPRRRPPTSAEQWGSGEPDRAS